LQNQREREREDLQSFPSIDFKSKSIEIRLLGMEDVLIADQF